MQTIFALLDLSEKDWTSPFFIFFWVFLFAALICLILWVFFLGNDSEEYREERVETGDEDTSAREDSSSTSAETETESESTNSGETTLAIDTASKGEAVEAFSDDIAAGNARFDGTYGVVYTATPDRVDDLTVISGVGKVLNGKLNDIGVYRYKQIAYWTKEACEEFNKLLTFKDRLYRDNWIEQAKSLHGEKYGDKLS